MQEQALVENKNILLKRLTTFFPKYKIVTLSELVEKISICPSVRGGDKKKLDYYDYYEVGLKDRNAYGVIEINPNLKKQLGAANKTMVFKYMLHKNDLLLPYKVSRHIRIARIEKEYDRPVVTNTSTIRIEINKSLPQDIAIIIQSYLDLPYVQYYLISSSKIPLSGRAALKTQTLLSLPIPKFEINDNIDYKKIYYKHVEMENISKEIHRYGTMLQYSLAIQKETTSHLLQSSTKSEFDNSQKDEIRKKMMKLLQELQKLEEIAYKSNENFFNFLKAYPFSRKHNL